MAELFNNDVTENKDMADSRNDQLGEVIIYTDGGCAPNPGPGGWAAVLISPAHDNFVREISGYEPDTTNNRMELTAAIEALTSLKKPCKVTLYTDSQYLRNAFTQGWIDGWIKKGWKTANRKPVANVDLWKKLIELEEIHKIEFKWVKAHNGNPNNERCDQLVQLAREAAI